MFHDPRCFCFSDDSMHCLKASYVKSGPEKNLMWQRKTQRAAFIDHGL